MKRRTDNKKRSLKLNKQTVRDLQTRDLETVVGGATITKTMMSCTSC